MQKININININYLKDFVCKERKKLGIYTILFLSFLRFVVYPMNERYDNKKQELQNEISSYLQDLKIYESKKPEEKKVQTVYKINPDEFYPPDTKSASIDLALMQIIKYYAEKHKLDIASFEVPKPVKGKWIETIKLKVRINNTTDYKSLFELLDIIKSMPRKTAITHLQIFTSGPNVSMYFSITSYKLVKIP